MLLKILNYFYIKKCLNCTCVGRFLNFLSVKLYLASVLPVLMPEQLKCIRIYLFGCGVFVVFPPGLLKEHHIHNENDKICLSHSDLESPDRKWCRQLAVECCSCDRHWNKASAQRFDAAHLLQGKQRMS